MIIRLCIKCGAAYNFDSKRYFSKYCKYCFKKADKKQRKIGIRIKNNMKIKYGERV